MIKSLFRYILIAYAITFAGIQASGAIEPLPWVPGSWTLAVMPDTQVYTWYSQYHEIFTSQTQWIADHKSDRNIAFTLHEGDITQHNIATEWERADTSLSILDGAGMGYALTLGNHDIGNNGNASDRTTLLNDYFPASRYDTTPTYGGVFETGKMDNSYHLFSAGGKDYIALALEFGPRDEIVNWADGILTQYADRTAMIVTHAYQFVDSTRYDFLEKGTSQRLNPHSFPLGAPNDGTANINDGQQLWDKLISKHANTSMVFSGHIASIGNGLLSSRGDEGQIVHQMLCDYQSLPSGGSGYMRLIEFLPDGETVQVKTYSPYLDEYMTDPSNQFVFTLNSIGPTSRTIRPEADTKIKDVLPDKVHGAESSITVGNEFDGTSSYKMYLRFDLASVEVEAASAELLLYQQAENMGPNNIETVDVFGLIDDIIGETTWSESTLTWNNAPANIVDSPTDFTNATPLGSFDVTGELGWFRFSSSALANFINADTNGKITLLFSTADKGLYGSFRSKEFSNTSLRPYLLVTEVPEPSSMLLICLAVLQMSSVLRRRSNCR
ncbi:MAG: DNRLRE domain-containing protein [Pirellulales bacterium]|nr:DNRLRE domain-containing protein [Pirellulales bacterium]